MSTAAITGAYGYLGSAIRERLQGEGWDILALVRTPRPGDEAQPWSLGSPLSADGIGEVDALIHCAYDFAPRKRTEIWKVNVEGSRRLLADAQRQGVKRILVLSSMSAYAGTAQLYGQAKLAIEAETLRAGGIAVRPGLVYGESPAGMAGALTQLTKLPLVPVLGGTAEQFPVHEDDFTQTILRILAAPTWISESFGIAQRNPVRFRDLLAGLARREGRTCRFVPIPWKPVYWILKLAERSPFSPSLRADSMLGLVKPASCVPQSTAFPDLLDNLRRFSEAEQPRSSREAVHGSC